jgi:DNA repair protein RecO (recombination protein O)
MATRALRTPATLSAFVLHHYDWSESSLILDLFTREQGRLAVVAKGAKRPYSQMRSVLLPFQRLQVSLGKPPKADTSGSEGASEVQTLRAAEWAGGGAMLTGAALFSGFYLNELLMKLLARGDPHPALFDLYTQTLPALAAQENDAQVALRAFEIALLKAIGLLPDLSLVTLTQEVVRADARYALQAEAGVVTARVADTAMPGQVLIGLQAALEHGSLAALQQACSPSLPELKAVLRGLLHYHLGSPVLRTRQVMLDVQALERSSP